MLDYLCYIFGDCDLIVEITHSWELDWKFQIPSDFTAVTQSCQKPGLNTATGKKGKARELICISINIIINTAARCFLNHPIQFPLRLLPNPNLSFKKGERGRGRKKEVENKSLERTAWSQEVQSFPFISYASKGHLLHCICYTKTGRLLCTTTWRFTKTKIDHLTLISI